MDKNFKIELYSDGAVIEDMVAMKSQGNITGFTTNPTLMKKAGIDNYIEFAHEALSQVGDLPISFEVFADDFETMEKEALKLASLGDNVFVKIPITNTLGESAIPLIRKLSEKNLKLNITAILTKEQVIATVDALKAGTENIVSVFAGRIADTGINPEPLMTEAVELCKAKRKTKLLWASTRELYNIVQADQLGVDIITVPPEILAKLKMYQMDLKELSLETVKMFNQDVKNLGFSILN
ncbi:MULTISPECIES: transaldolase [unclassified Enterococcus]|uniref:transaldolase n=1 Tax=unclassified Enterococcus TaxID=2608891 RepID=UPI001556C84B|nr:MULTISPECIES: transaldolase [unclassified Enterococcus]MBS7578169.1 transaldolase [Enterococcus sp. MMGLQ5-2]MBS7584015.1 transaldolase [Enterococcus sp. MMGLQ5-1]NPD11876.1 transaldolase [Enterococcus sp. MMGLQ5-1]NPD38000.1 transaldolase [Enterococcus sp. MMGLQ5-2]